MNSTDKCQKLIENWFHPIPLLDILRINLIPLLKGQFQDFTDISLAMASEMSQYHSSSFQNFQVEGRINLQSTLVTTIMMPGLRPPTKYTKKKTVSFDEDHLENVMEFEDDVDSKHARETFWEMQARDRVRFQDRIDRTGEALGGVLTPGHRVKIYQQRFCEKN